MSLRAAMRNARRATGYARHKEDFRINVEAAADTTLGDLFARGRELEKERMMDGGNVEIENGRVVAISKTFTDEEMAIQAQRIAELEDRYEIVREGRKIIIRDKKG